MFLIASDRFVYAQGPELGSRDDRGPNANPSNPGNPPSSYLAFKPEGVGEAGLSGSQLHGPPINPISLISLRANRAEETIDEVIVFQGHAQLSREPALDHRVFNDPEN
jgi:hypothetical protein